MDTANHALSRADDQYLSRTAALAEITRAIATSPDVCEAFAVVSRQARHVLPHDALVVLQSRADSDYSTDARLDVAYCQFCDHVELAVSAGESWSPASFSFDSAFSDKQAVVVSDLAATAHVYPGDRILCRAGSSALVVPIQASPRVLGLLILIGRTAGMFRQADALLAEPIASLLAVALAHQRRERQASASAVAEERNRLAREIHDTQVHSLTGIMINLESLKPYAVGRSQADADVLAEIEEMARNALVEARRSVLGLSPTPLQHQSLHDALAQELAGLGKRAGLACQFYVAGAERLLAAEVAAALFRVAQEAIHNIEKHAAARSVILRLAFEAEVIILTIEDDGVGFAPDAVTPNNSGGFGLLSMAARARSLDGQLHVTSHAGHGTTVRCAFPYVRPHIAANPGAVPVPPIPGAHPIRVLVVDDHPVARQGIQIVGEADDGFAAIEQTARLRPDVILLDVQMPRLSGIEALPRLHATHPGVEVVMLTLSDQDEQLFASFKAGARGYLLKDATSDSIVEAVRAASHGQSTLPPALATRLVERFSALAQREVDPDALTEREVEILTSMTKGLRYKEIAMQLHITIHTVQYHVTNILQKLHVESRAEAVAVVAQRGLFDRVQ